MIIKNLFSSLVEFFSNLSGAQKLTCFGWKDTLWIIWRFSRMSNIFINGVVCLHFISFRKQLISCLVSLWAVLFSVSVVWILCWSPNKHLLRLCSAIVWCHLFSYLLPFARRWIFLSDMSLPDVSRAGYIKPCPM